MEEKEFARLYFMQTEDVRVLVVSLLEETQSQGGEQNPPSGTTDKDD